MQLTVTLLANLHRADVERRLTLPLQLVVIDVRTLANDDLRHRVGEILAVAQRNVALDDCGA